ncbi:MAG TPA: TolC family protein [Pirellulales bacterium]|nr:TolC family protein [Pirellulales bacterium]
MLLQASPQLRAAEVRLGHARAEPRREQAQPIPNLTVQTVTEYDKTTGSTNVSTLLALPVPLYNRNQGNIFHAYADIREAQAEIERVRLVLRDTLAASFRRYEVVRNSVEQLRSEILTDAKENLDLTTAGYKAGEFDFARVLAARQTYFQSNLSYVESLAELRKIVVEIEGLQLTGGLNPATLGTAIQSQGGFRQQGLLNQLQDSATKQILPPAVQAATP